MKFVYFTALALEPRIWTDVVAQLIFIEYTDEKERDGRKDRLLSFISFSKYITFFT